MSSAAVSCLVFVRATRAPFPKRLVVQLMAKRTQVQWKLGSSLGILATLFGQLGLTSDELLWLALTLVEIWSNLLASWLAFFIVWPSILSNASWVTSIYSNLSTNAAGYVAFKWDFCDKRVLQCEETYEVIWPPNAILYARHVNLRLLKSLFGQGLRS